MTSKERHICDYRHIIGAAKRRLGDSVVRFNEGAIVSMREACLKDLYPPTIDECISASLGTSSDAGVKKMTEEFWEEIKALEECIKESDFEVRVPEWTKGVRFEGSEQTFKAWNLRYYALQMWNWYALPIRYRTEKVYVIWTAGDGADTPAIQVFEAESFLAELVLNRSGCHEEKGRLEKRMWRWKNIGITSLIALSLVLWACLF